jgi:hypothetical protein
MVGAAVSVTAGAVIALQTVRVPATTRSPMVPATAASAVVQDTNASVMTARQVHSIPIVEPPPAPKVVASAGTNEVATGAGSTPAIAAPSIATAAQQASAALGEPPAVPPVIGTKTPTASAEPAPGEVEHRTSASRRKARIARLAAKATAIEAEAVSAQSVSGTVAPTTSTPRWRTLSDLVGR